MIFLPKKTIQMVIEFLRMTKVLVQSLIILLKAASFRRYYVSKLLQSFFLKKWVDSIVWEYDKSIIFCGKKLPFFQDVSEISIILEIENKYCITSRKKKKTIVENVRASRKEITKAACVSCFAMSERFGFMKLHM